MCSATTATWRTCWRGSARARRSRATEPCSGWSSSGPSSRRSGSKILNPLNQCSGSVCFWASWIRIFLYGTFYQQAKKLRKTLISTVLWILCEFLSLKNDLNVPSKGISIKNLLQHYLLLTSWRSLTKRAGSGFVPKCHGSGTQF